MSNLAAPFGLRPAFHPKGKLRQLEATIISGLLSDIYQFSPVAIDPATGALIVVGHGNPVVGSFMGVEWTGLDGRRRVGNHWVPGTVGTNIVAYYSEDPVIIYEIQSNEPVPLSSVGLEFLFSAITGNNITGLSSVALDHAGGSVAVGDCRIIGLNPSPYNEYGDAFTVVQVQLSNHQYVATLAVPIPPGNLFMTANEFRADPGGGNATAVMGIRIMPAGFWQTLNVPGLVQFPWTDVGAFGVEWIDDGGASAAQFETQLVPLNIGDMEP